jgi:hypothetical protein
MSTHIDPAALLNDSRVTPEAVTDSTPLIRRFGGGENQNACFATRWLREAAMARLLARCMGLPKHRLMRRQPRTVLGAKRGVLQAMRLRGLVLLPERLYGRRGTGIVPNSSSMNLRGSVGANFGVDGAVGAGLLGGASAFSPAGFTSKLICTG